MLHECLDACHHTGTKQEWRQSKFGLITQATQSVFLVSEVLGELGSVVAAQVLAALSNGLEQYLGVTPTTFLVDEQQSTISW